MIFCIEKYTQKNRPDIHQIFSEQRESKHQTAGRDRMPVHLHPKTIDKVDADKRHHPGIDKRGSHAADRNIIGDQEIRLPYDFIDTCHNGIKRLYNQPH